MSQGSFLSDADKVAVTDHTVLQQYCNNRTEVLQQRKNSILGWKEHFKLPYCIYQIV